MASVRHRRPAGKLAGLAALLFATVAAAGNDPPGESAAQLRARATRYFQRKQFAAACPLFEAANRASPGQPELLADLALCQHRVGNDDLARQTNLEAIARASEPAERIDEPRFARVRRHAYFNLAELDGVPSVGAALDHEQSCWQLEAAPGCAKRLNACGVGRTDGGRTYRSDRTVIRVAASADAARFDDGDAPLPDFASLSAPNAQSPTLIDADSALDYVESFSEEAQSFDCEWTCEKSNAVAAEIEKCQSNAKLSVATRAQCPQTVCDRAERAPWAAVKAEQRESDACYQYAASVDGQYGCQLLYANACTGLLALRCSGHAGGEHEQLTHIEEYRLVLP